MGDASATMAGKRNAYTVLVVTWRKETIWKTLGLDIWLISGGLFLERQWTIGSYKIRGIYWLAKEPSGSQ
jgi:hypothetical protein